MRAGTTHDAPRAGGCSDVALAVVAVAAIAGMALLAAAVSGDPPPALDLEALRWARTTFGAGAARAVLDALNTLGSFAVGAIFTTTVAVALVVSGHRLGAAVVLATWIAGAASELVKVAVMRERPEGVVVPGVFGESFAYPSGHVVRAVAIASALAWLVLPRTPARPWLALVGGIVAGLLMGLARVGVGVHWPTDVLGGMLLSTAWFCLVTLLAQRLAGRRRLGEG
jgi:undecaprenyl-diphosphatase